MSGGIFFYLHKFAWNSSSFSRRPLSNRAIWLHCDYSLACGHSHMQPRPFSLSLCLFPVCLAFHIPEVIYLAKTLHCLCILSVFIRLWNIRWIRILVIFEFIICFKLLVFLLQANYCYGYCAWVTLKDDVVLIFSQLILFNTIAECTQLIKRQTGAQRPQGDHKKVLESIGLFGLKHTNV